MAPSLAQPKRARRSALSSDEEPSDGEDTRRNAAAPARNKRARPSASVGAATAAERAAKAPRRGDRTALAMEIPVTLRVQLPVVVAVRGAAAASVDAPTADCGGGGSGGLIPTHHLLGGSAPKPMPHPTPPRAVPILAAVAPADARPLKHPRVVRENAVEHRVEETEAGGPEVLTIASSSPHHG